MSLAFIVAIGIGVQQLTPIGAIIRAVQFDAAYGNQLQSIADFPYQCQRIEHLSYSLAKICGYPSGPEIVTSML